jgi:phosphatidylserine synthase
MSISKIISAVLTPPDRLLNWIVGKGFGLKDVFTLLNLAGGVAGIILVFFNKPIEASYAVLAGFAVGDSLDGFVARMTNHSNQFGSDFDTITDHLAQNIAPAFIVFGHFRFYNVYLASAMAFLIIAAGSIRHARGTAVSFGYSLSWKGLPRPIAAMLLFAYFNSKFFAYIPYSQWVGVAMVVGVCYGLLTDYPFISHHGRKLQWWAFSVTLFAYSAAVLQALFYRVYFWDSLFFFMLVYIFGGWIVMHKEELVTFWEAVDKWRDELEK